MLILRDTAGLVLAITKEKRPGKPAALEKGKQRGARLLWEPGAEVHSQGCCGCTAEELGASRQPPGIREISPVILSKAPHVGQQMSTCILPSRLKKRRTTISIKTGFLLLHGKKQRFHMSPSVCYRECRLALGDTERLPAFRR